MKYLLLFTIIIFTSCGSGTHQFAKAENSLDAGREFIDAILKGNFEKANFYMLNDEANKKLLLEYQTKYNLQSREEKLGLNQSEIIILQVEDISDKETIINYSNSFDKIKHKIKVINKNGDWFVDFKYTFDGNL
ncbi:hypothetical protein GALL_167970 [mine drainage metagenome]|uniref:Uncharacterized protein n=1 Tax=mine drainage metagenome TaxID=410659 RepID=A0A1J5SHI9_9ZZZZ